MCRLRLLLNDELWRNVKSHVTVDNNKPSSQSRPFDHKLLLGPWQHKSQLGNFSVDLFLFIKNM